MSKFYFGHVKDTSLIGYATPICLLLIVHIANDLSNTSISKLLHLRHLEIIMCIISHFSHCNSNLILSVLIMTRNNLDTALLRGVFVMKNMVTVSHLTIIIWHNLLPASWASKLWESDRFSLSIFWVWVLEMFMLYNITAATSFLHFGWC